MNRSLLRRALAPRWLRWWAVALLAALACAALGNWQWQRYVGKAATVAAVERHYTAPARPVTEVLTAEPMPREREWTRVEAVGEYRGQQLVVRNRPREARYGYEVLAALRLADGSTLVVDRGWIPFPPGGATAPPQIPPAPAGTVTVVGWVRPSEPSLNREPPTGQVASIELAAISRAWRTPVLGGYLIRQTENGRSPGNPADLDPPDTDTGPHLAYAIQWWVVGPAAFVLVWFAIRREEREDGAEESAPRPPKVRIWDEEDG